MSLKVVLNKPSDMYEFMFCECLWVWFRLDLTVYLNDCFYVPFVLHNHEATISVNESFFIGGVEDAGHIKLQPKIVIQ